METKHVRRHGLGLLLIAGLLGPSSAFAATPPPSVNYQGVLRDQNDAPLSGSFDMVLRFMDAESGGNEILVDQHALATANAVVVSDGLFNVALGSGTISDGSGPGTYASLAEVFRDYGSVWLQVSIGAETLNPRTRIHSSPYALNTAQLGGHPPGAFLDTFTSSQTKNGKLHVVNTADNQPAVFGQSSVLGGIGLQGLGNLYGVVAGGATAGEFQGGQYGVRARGSVAAGRFEAISPGDGVSAESYAGVAGRFVAPAGTGVLASGNVAGGDFTSALGIGVRADGFTWGVRSSGGTYGVYSTGGDHGVRAEGGNYGGYFTTSNVDSYGIYADGVHTGVRGHGGVRGGAFSNTATGAYAEIGVGTWKIVGVGSMSFVQNHPDDPSKVIVYAAPEGDEVAVYTRGSGRLLDGEAHVKLGETFALVTNPDIGLTATATPRGEPIPLAVAELSAGEMIVRGPEGSNVEFDYLVWGLRIGFEEQSIVQPKRRDSKIPSMHEHEEFFRQDPALRGYTALARFRAVEGEVHGRSEVDLTQAHRLRDAVGVFPPGNPLDEPIHGTGRLPNAPPSDGTSGSAEPGGLEIEEQRPRTRSVIAPSSEPTRTQRDEQDLFDVVGTIVPGDVVSLVAASPGAVVRSAGPDDALVVGCTEESAAAAPGRVAVVANRVAVCRVDASFGAVAVGDRLIASPVPGVAMLAAPDASTAATLGRAIDPLDSGADVIRVLLGAR